MDNIEIVQNKKGYSVLNDMRNPIIIKVDKNKMINNEKDLELTILSEIEFILTIGIIISKEQDKFVATFIKSDKLPLTYELINK